MNPKQPTGQQREPGERNIMQQGSIQDDLRARQEGTPNTKSVVQHSMRPRYPNWPTSRPGPLASQPGVGQQPINALRREQMVEVGYNQETGTPRTQSATGPMRICKDERALISSELLSNRLSKGTVPLVPGRANPESSVLTISTQRRNERHANNPKRPGGTGMAEGL
jgi:hypothetical protein